MSEVTSSRLASGLLPRGRVAEAPRSSLGHFPAGNAWAFDGSVADVFDDMLARSIPQYPVMRNVVTDVAGRFVQPGTDVVDLGCSRGEAMAPLVARFGAANRFVGIEVSPPMLEASRVRFAGYPESVVSIRDLDLRAGYPPVRASVTLAVLTLMFTPINHRARLVADVRAHTVPGGALLLVEKVLGSSAVTDALMVDRYHRMKADNGYSREEIERKALALEGVQVPITAAWNEDLLRASFDHVECVWRWMNFAAWIAVRDARERDT